MRLFTEQDDRHEDFRIVGVLPGDGWFAHIDMKVGQRDLTQVSAVVGWVVVEDGTAFPLLLNNDQWTARPRTFSGYISRSEFS